MLGFDEGTAASARRALAAYSAGWAHLTDARQLARARSLDPDKWFKNVERAMLLLQQPAYYAHARHGYVGGPSRCATSRKSGPTARTT